MKITQIECLIAASENNNIVFVKTSTDSGIYGLGEAYRVGPDQATISWVSYFEQQLIGRDPTEIERNWALMYQGARFPIGSSGLAALSGIDQSLWDIAAKAIDQPVYRLLGGEVRDRIRAYHGIHGGTAKELANDAKRRVDEGFTALKTNPLPPEWREMLWNDAVAEARRRFEAVRKAIGPNIDVGFDAHAAVWEPWRIVDLSDALLPYGPWFMEEPLRMENRHEMGQLRKKLPFALATGECLYTRYELGELMREKAVDILQPDVCIVGGMTEMRKIAFMAEAEDLVVAPHNPMGPLATTVNLHFDAATTNFLVQEYRTPSPSEAATVNRTPKPIDGYFPMPDGPGWGIDIVPSEIASRPYAKPWRRGDRTLPDGAIAFI